LMEMLPINRHIQWNMIRHNHISTASPMPTIMVINRHDSLTTPLPRQVAPHIIGKRDRKRRHIGLFNRHKNLHKHPPQTTLARPIDPHNKMNSTLPPQNRLMPKSNRHILERWQIWNTQIPQPHTTTSLATSGLTIAKSSC